MTFLPIAERELRVAARSPRTYWSRAFAALAVIIIAMLVFDSYGRFGRSKVGGQQVFSALAALALAYVLFGGAALTADCLSSEKREETLGFLFLTDLKGYDVVLGKLVATSLRSIYGLLSTFPILSLPLLLGGMRASEFWRVILVLLNTLLLSLSMGLLVSTLLRAVWFTTAGLFILTIADCIALGWLGMWAGLRVRHVPNGAALCLCKVVLPPAIMARVFICHHGLTSADEYLKTNPFWIPALWLGVGLATDSAGASGRARSY